MGHKISKEQIDPGVKDHIMSFVGNKNELETSDKSDMVNAINSLIVDRVDNAANMNKLANSIGNPITASDNVDEVCDKVNGLLSTFKTNMMNSGVMVEGTDKFKQLIDKIKGLTEGEGNKGIQFAQGNGKQISVDTLTDEGISVDIDFEPMFLFLAISNRNTPSYTDSGYHGSTDTLGVAAICIPDLILADSSRTIGLGAIGNGIGSSYYYNIIFNTGLTDGKITVKKTSIGPSWIYGSPAVDYDWYAIGVGEEDTTLRDSLASILQDEGVTVTEEDDMADLITKVDEEFDNRKQILVNALVNEGLNAEITNTYEELITMISLLKYVPANSIINGDSTDSDFINRLTSYSINRGDADSKITYSVSNNTIIVEGSADCVETTNGQADEGKRDLYIYNPSYTVDVTDYDVFKVIASYSFYDMEYGCLEVGLYTGSDYKNPVKTIENGDLDITDLTGEYHIVINAFVWNEYHLGETGILEGKVSYIGFE